MDFLRRDFSSALRSTGIIEARIGGRLTVEGEFVVAAFNGSDNFGGFGSEFEVDWCSLLVVVEDVVFGGEISSK